MMLVYISHWAKNDNDPEHIVECDPWVDKGDDVLNLTLKDRNGRLMTLQLDKFQVKKVIDLVSSEMDFTYAK